MTADESDRPEEVRGAGARADVIATASLEMLDSLRELRDWIDDIDDPSEEDVARMITGAVDLALLNEARIAAMVVQLRGLVAVFEDRRTGTDLAATLRTHAAVLDSLAGCARTLAAAEEIVTLVGRRCARTAGDH